MSPSLLQQIDETLLMEAAQIKWNKTRDFF